MGESIQHHECTNRSKIEAVVAKTRNINSQDYKGPERSKEKSKIRNLSNVMLSTKIGKLEECRHLRLVKGTNVWANSFSNELGRLNQAMYDIEVTDCMKFITHSEVPKDKNATCNRPQKEEAYRVHTNTGIRIFPICSILILCMILTIHSTVYVSNNLTYRFLKSISSYSKLFLPALTHFLDKKFY